MIPFIVALGVQAGDASGKPAQDPADDTAAPSYEFSGLEAVFRDGLRFRTKDGNFEARIGGRMIAHYRHIVDRPDDSNSADGLRTLPNSFFMRQTRIEVDGMAWKEFNWRVQYDLFAAG